MPITIPASMNSTAASPAMRFHCSCVISFCMALCLPRYADMVQCIIYCDSPESLTVLPRKIGPMVLSGIYLVILPASWYTFGGCDTLATSKVNWAYDEHF